VSDAAANADAIAAWNTVLFDKFVQYRPTLVGALGPHGRRALERHPPPAAARVVDLGCGFGDTAIDLAHRVGPSGHVVGIDAAARFIEAARREAADANVANVSFAVADIEAGVPGGPYDVAFSRMGTMFFARPVIALRNVRAALAPRGRLCMVVWRSKAANEFMRAAEDAVRAILGSPEKGDNVTCGPGPFSMSSPDVVGDQLVAAGYTDISFDRSDVEISMGADLDEAVALALDLGPAGEIVRLAGDAAAERRDELVGAVRDSLRRYVHPDGVRAPSATWIVTARARR
jgi:SAM-dependent methyltransferase